MPQYYHPKGEKLFKIRKKESPNSSRARRLALWLLENANEVNEADNLQITFNCSGAQTQVEVKHRHKIDTKELDDLSLATALADA